MQEDGTSEEQSFYQAGESMPLQGDEKKTGFTYSVAYYPADGYEKQGACRCSVCTDFGCDVSHCDPVVLCTGFL